MGITCKHSSRFSSPLDIEYKELAILVSIQKLFTIVVQPNVECLSRVIQIMGRVHVNALKRRRRPIQIEQVES